MEPGWVERVYLGDQKYGRILQKNALGPKNSKQGQTALFFPILKIDGTSGARMFLLNYLGTKGAVVDILDGCRP